MSAPFIFLDLSNAPHGTFQIWQGALGGVRGFVVDFRMVVPGPDGPRIVAELGLAADPADATNMAVQFGRSYGAQGVFQINGHHRRGRA